MLYSPINSKICAVSSLDESLLDSVSRPVGLLFTLAVQVAFNSNSCLLIKKKTLIAVSSTYQLAACTPCVEIKGCPR